jgi:fission process protein 1
MATTTETVVAQAQEKVTELADQNAATTDSSLRYAAYGARLRTALRAGSRYIAYTSDVGEAFRPIVAPWVVRAGYGVSWAYLAGDVGYEAFKAHRLGPSPIEAANFSEPTRLAIVTVHRATFQSIASMALPAFTIHTIVKQAKKVFVNNPNPRIKVWGPTLTGLAVVPILPYLFDHPVEAATETVFEWIKDKIAKNPPQPVPSSDKKDEL